jgi:hypothetical protein
MTLVVIEGNHFAPPFNLIFFLFICDFIMLMHDICYRKNIGDINYGVILYRSK